MDLKIKYNKDKSRMQVALTVEPARYVHESRVYNTAFIVEELGKKGISVEKGHCTIPTKVFNYSGLEKCTGTWTFSLPTRPKSTESTKSTQPAKSEETKSKKTVSKPTAPRKRTTTARTPNRKTTKKV